MIVPHEHKLSWHLFLCLLLDQLNLLPVTDPDILDFSICLGTAGALVHP